MQPALFLDRDGIINIDTGYVGKIEDFTFIPAIFELVRQAQALGYRIVVVTNQSGIGRGYYTEKDFERLTGWMLTQFEQRNCYNIKVYYCPHHVDAKLSEYRKDCNCRKPNDGMLRKAAKDNELDLARSVLLGDKRSDVEAAINAGLAYAYWLTDSAEALSELSQQGATQVIRVAQVGEVADLIPR